MKVLAKHLASVSFAIAKNDVRYYLEGIHFSRIPNTDFIRVQATNGHILARYDTTETWLIDEIDEYIVQFTSDQLRDIRNCRACVGCPNSCSAGFPSNGEALPC